MTCHACARDATLTLRVVPFTSTRTLWDSTPRDVNACSQHVQAARQIGTVVKVTPLSSDVVHRTVQP